MKYTIEKLVIIVFAANTILFQCLSCSANGGSPKHDFNVILVDSIKAAELIATDNSDYFFDQITPLEMSIQMKTSVNYPDRASALAAFIPYLKTQVSEPTEANKAFVDSMFFYVKQGLEALNSNLLLEQINIVKVKTDHYGPDVFYTRENSIFIPDNVFKSLDWKAQIPVMYHEVWHILSRKNPSLKKSAYALIGFKPHSKNLIFEEGFASTILTNPDGANYEYALSMNGQEILPIISSKKDHFDTLQPSFFDYLNFDFYDIDSSGRVDRQPAPLASMEGLYAQIKDNTQYIIHPDEIMADNFMMAVASNLSQDYSKYSPGGKELIDDFTTILKEFHE